MAFVKSDFSAALSYALSSVGKQDLVLKDKQLEASVHWEQRVLVGPNWLRQVHMLPDAAVPV